MADFQAQIAMFEAHSDHVQQVDADGGSGACGRVSQSSDDAGDAERRGAKEWTFAATLNAYAPVRDAEARVGVRLYPGGRQVTLSLKTLRRRLEWLTPMFRLRFTTFIPRRQFDTSSNAVPVIDVDFGAPAPPTPMTLAGVVERSLCMRYPSRLDDDGAVIASRSAEYVTQSLSKFRQLHGDAGASVTFDAMVPFYNCMRTQVLKMRNNPDDDTPDFLGDPETWRYFSAAVIKKMAPAYPSAVLHEQVPYILSPTRALALYQQLCDDPFVMCFRTRYPRTVLNERGRSVSELTVRGYIRAALELVGDDDIDVARVLAVCMYAVLKDEYFRNKNLYMDIDDWYAQAHGMCVAATTGQHCPRTVTLDEARAATTEAEQLLVATDVVCALHATEDDYGLRPVFLHYTYTCLTTIRASLERVRDRFIRHRLTAHAEPPVAPWTGQPPCDEQRAALDVYERSPLLLVDGPGGAGKSELLHMIVARRPHARRLVTAFPNQVTSMLRQRLGVPTCFTAHMFIYAHAMSHKRVPTMVKKAFAKVNMQPAFEGACIFAGVEELIIDEMSVMYPALLSVLLDGLSRCGQLRRVIMVGDHAQLPSITAGSLWPDMLEAFEGSDAAASVRRFVHNHRVERSEPWMRPLARINEHVRRHETAEAMRLLTRFEPAQLTTAMTPRLSASAMECRTSTTMFETSEHIVDLLRHMFRALDCTPAEFVLRHQVMTYRRNGVGGAPGDLAVLNDALTELYRALTKVRAVTTRTGKQRGCYIGQKVMFKVNDHDIGVYNNEVLYLERIVDYGGDGDVLSDAVRSSAQSKTRGTARRVYVCREVRSGELAGRTVYVDAFSDTGKRMVRASAVTNYCFQGGQAPIIIYAIMPPRTGGRYYETRQSMYTAIGRAQRQLVLVATAPTIRRALTNESQDRRTGLAIALRGSSALLTAPGGAISSASSSTDAPSLPASVSPPPAKRARTA